MGRGRKGPKVIPNPNAEPEDGQNGVETVGTGDNPNFEDDDDEEGDLDEGRPMPESLGGPVAEIEEELLEPEDDSNVGLSESDVALRDAQKITQMEFQAARKARQRAILEQQGHGQVNIKEADQAAQDAAVQVRENAIAKQGPGLFVKTGVVLHNENGQRIECPEGMKIPPKMEAKVGPKEVRRLILKKVLVRRG